MWKKQYIYIGIASALYILMILCFEGIPGSHKIPKASNTKVNVFSHHWAIIEETSELNEINENSTTIQTIIFNGDEKYEAILAKKNIKFLNSKSESNIEFKSKDPKTIHFLLAIKNGAKFISESISEFSFNQTVKNVAFRRQRSHLINIFPTFMANWSFHSPGFPVEELLNVTQDGWSSTRIVDDEQEKIRPLIHQQLIVEENISWLFIDHPPVAVEPLTFTPFSSENIIFSYDAFWALLLPRSKSFYWRSWWVQRLLHDIDGHLIFSSILKKNNFPSSNTKIYQGDKQDEEIGKLVRFLSQWESTKTDFKERIKDIFLSMSENSFCSKTELENVLSWLDDLDKINYKFPVIKRNLHEKKSSNIRRRRTAICLTGLIECTEEAWRPAHRQIRNHISGEIDTFMYLSSTEPIVEQLPTIPLKNRIVEVLRYSDFTVKVLFENIPKLDPKFPANCTSDKNVDQPGYKIPRYYQQLFGLANCFALVQDYERKHNIKYELMIRIRADLQFLHIPSTFDRDGRLNINKTMILPPNRYGSVVDDGFAIGPIELIEVYMNRFYSFQECLTRDLHPERYLHFYLFHRKVSIVVDKETVVAHIPHDPNHCH